ncbi:ergothioneine biosynthesis glutamate--cysteine ligase EgtA, partial [Streptomyces fimicarius]
LALERMGASQTVRDTVAAFTDRYVARGRCPAAAPRSRHRCRAPFARAPGPP